MRPETKTRPHPESYNPPSTHRKHCQLKTLISYAAMPSASGYCMDIGGGEIIGILGTGPTAFSAHACAR